MAIKLLIKVGIILAITITVSLIFYDQNKSHIEEVKRIEINNKIHIEQLKSDYNNQITEQKEITDSVILDKENRIMKMSFDIEKLQSYLGIKEKQNNVVSLISKSPEFIVTAYDLSIQSCGKPFSSRWYGITASGKNLKGLDLRSASTISTDPKIIPLGSIVYLYFLDNNAKNYNGLYIANDTGSAIKGNKIDLFFGDFNSQNPSSSAMNFGKQIAKVIKIE